MPSNPMQRKVRNSFIAGIFVMLLIVLIVGAAVFFLIVKPKMDKAKEEEQQIAYVYRLKKKLKYQLQQTQQTSFKQKDKAQMESLQVLHSQEDTQVK